MPSPRADRRPHVARPQRAARHGHRAGAWPGGRRRWSPAAPSGRSRPARRCPTISPLWTVRETSVNSPVQAQARAPRARAAVSGRRRRGGAGRRTRWSRPVIRRDQVAGRGRLGVEVHRRGPAVLEHRDPVADVADLLEPVRDVDDRDALRGQVADDPEQVGHLVVGQHRARLVHDEQPGVLGQRPGHAHDLLGRRRAASPPRASTGISPCPSRASTARGRRPRICPRCTKPSRRGSRPRKTLSATLSPSTRSSSW